jgi:Membrane-bound metallopeptidase
MIIVKKEFFKSKRFYVSLCVGAFVLLTMGVVTYSMFGVNNQEGTPNQEQVQNNQTNTNKNDVVKTVPIDPKQQVKATPAKDAAVKQNAKAETKKADVAKNEKKSTEKTAKKESENAVAVINTDSKIDNLHFNEEKGLLWPITGNVIMNYSMDTTILFKTLGQYKCNPAIIISGKVGSDVFCSATGVVTDIDNSDETGLTVTTSIGNGYSLVYGQLKDVTVKVGDNIAEGNKIGKIAKQSRYYDLEGSNLFFEVLQNDKPVNPLLLLRD